MPKDGTETRTQIMDTAEALILDHGYAGTSVEAIVEAAGVTKGAFFHHFRSKMDLARALVERYADLDAGLLERTMEEAERASDDPAEQLVAFVELCAEEMEEFAEPHPGCLFASFCYEAQLFDADTHRIIRDATVLWRERLGAKVREAVALHPPRIEVDPDALADMLWVVFEGSFLLSRAMADPEAVAVQLRQYRGYLELLFGVV
ncbi:MAG TPA: TetR family transcriptional regulator [Longimicrobiales bacterium]